MIRQFLFLSLQINVKQLAYTHRRLTKSQLSELSIFVLKSPDISYPTQISQVKEVHVSILYKADNVTVPSSWLQVGALIE